jgi:hypothetical protein
MAAGPQQQQLYATRSGAGAAAAAARTTPTPPQQQQANGDGDAVAAASAQLLAQPQYLPFTAAAFSAADFTSRVLAGSRTTAAAQSEELRSNVRRLDAVLGAAVAAGHSELLTHARRMSDAEAGAREVAAAVASLQAAARRARAEVEGPYLAAALKARQLGALHSTVELLRALLLRLKLTAKLRALLEPSSSSASSASAEPLDLQKAAKLLSDIAAAADFGSGSGYADAGAGGGDGLAVPKRDGLAGVALAAADAPWLEAAGLAVREKAHAALSEGMDSMSQAKVGAALQVFFNLGELAPAVDGLITKQLHELERAARSALDSRHLSLGVAAAARGEGGIGGGGPGGARGLTLPQPGAAGSWQERLWAGLKGVADVFVAGGAAVWHLQRVAAKKRDPLSHVLFLDELCGGGANDGGGGEEEGGGGAPQLLTDRYWCVLFCLGWGCFEWFASSTHLPMHLNPHPPKTSPIRPLQHPRSEALRVLSDAFATASKPSKGGFVREALSSGYPKLVTLLEASFSRLLQETGGVRGVPPAVAAGQLPALLAAAAPFRDSYLAASLGRLQDVINHAFGGGGRPLPSPADVQKCIAAMHEELRAAGGSEVMSSQVAAVVGSALQLLSQRAEYMAAAGPEMRELQIGPLTAGGAGGGVGMGGGGPSQAQLRNIALASQLQEVHR